MDDIGGEGGEGVVSHFVAEVWEGFCEEEAGREELPDFFS